MLYGAHPLFKNITKLFVTRAQSQKRTFQVIQIRRSQSQLYFRVLEIILVEILYTPGKVDPTEKVSTFRLPRLPLLIASRSNDSTSLSPTGSSNVSDMSAITLPCL